MLPEMVAGQLPTPGFEQYVPVYAASALGRARAERNRETRKSIAVDGEKGRQDLLLLLYCRPHAANRPAS